MERSLRAVRLKGAMRLLSCTMLISLILGSQLLFAAGTDRQDTPAPHDKSMYTWTLKIHLDCAMGEGSSYFYESLFEEQEAFSGFSDDLVYDANTSTFTYILSGPTSTLPANAEIAIISITNPDCGGNMNWMVRTDGGATVVLLQEF